MDMVMDAMVDGEMVGILPCPSIYQSLSQSVTTHHHTYGQPFGIDRYSEWHGSRDLWEEL